jgi:hypothetical protein
MAIAIVVVVIDVQETQILGLLGSRPSRAVAWEGDRRRERMRFRWGRASEVWQRGRWDVRSG